MVSGSSVFNNTKEFELQLYYYIYPRNNKKYVKYLLTKCINKTIRIYVHMNKDFCSNIQQGFITASNVTVTGNWFSRK